MTTDWFVDNASRAFPFVMGAVGNPDGTALQVALPLYAIVDAQLLFGPTVAFDTAANRVYLASVSRDGNDLDFTWRYNATSDLLLSDRLIVMTVTASDAHQVVTASYGIPTSGGLDCTDDISWELQLVFGPLLSRLDEWIADGETIDAVDDEVYFEPGCIQSLYRQHVRSINLANAARTRAEADEDCEALDWPLDAQDYYVQQTCLNGNLRFQEGFNSSIEVNAAANRIIFNARPGAGRGEVCEEPAITPDEMPPANRSTLDGGLRCDEVLRSLNGISGKSLPFLAGTGVQVEAVPNENKLIVTVGVGSSAGCRSIETGDEDLDCNSSAAAATTTTSDACDSDNAPRWIWFGEWFLTAYSPAVDSCPDSCKPIPPTTAGTYYGEVRRGACGPLDYCGTAPQYEWASGPYPARGWYPLEYTCLSPCTSYPPATDGDYDGEIRIGTCE